MMTSRKRTFEEFLTSHSCSFSEDTSTTKTNIFNCLPPSSPPPAETTNSNYNVFPTSINNRSDGEKRFQKHKIHSEVHTHTIEIMMNAQLQLQRQEKLQCQQPPPPQQQEEVKLDSEGSNEESTYYQRPYW